jgi:hypothetical protein
MMAHETGQGVVEVAIRNAAAFVLGPAAIALGIAYFVSIYPPQFAHPSQAAALQFTAVAPILALGALGVFVAALARMTPDPFAPRQLGMALTAALGSGALLGLLVLGLDAVTGFSSLVARRLGIESIHIEFPASLYVYAAGAIAVECLYRLIPVSLLYWLIARLLLRGRGEGAVFWSLAALSALIEPLSQAGLAEASSSLVWVLFAAIFAFNLAEVALWRRYGWIALIVSRLAFYLVWHIVAGPLLARLL